MRITVNLGCTRNRDCQKPGGGVKGIYTPMIWFSFDIYKKKNYVYNNSFLKKKNPPRYKIIWPPLTNNYGVCTIFIVLVYCIWKLKRTNIKATELVKYIGYKKAYYRCGFPIVRTRTYYHFFFFLLPTKRSVRIYNFYWHGNKIQSVIVDCIFNKINYKRKPVL